MNCDQFRQMALSFQHTSDALHFNRTAFKVANKRIFATLHEKSETANLKFSPADQSVFCLINKEIIYPVDNKWALQGWTTFKLDKISNELMQDALDTAYKETFKTSPKKQHNYR